MKNGHTSAASATGTPWAVGALLGSAALWGVSWYPYRMLAALGLSGLWSLALANLLATLICLALFRRVWRDPAPAAGLAAIGLLSGLTNAAFILGTLQGEVLRVTLLLYLAPVWTIFLARTVLGERIRPAGVGIVALSLLGAAVMLTGDAGGEAAALGTADALGLVAGLTYAGYNVAVRKASDVSMGSKTFVSSLGSVLVAACAIPIVTDALAAPPAATALAGGALWFWLAATGALMVGVVVLMQYGLARITATRATVIMVSELVFAAASAWWLADEMPAMREWLGGALILLAALLSSRLGGEGGDEDRAVEKVGAA